MNETPKKLAKILITVLISLILGLFLILGISINQRQSLDDAWETVQERPKFNHLL